MLGKKLLTVCFFVSIFFGHVACASEPKKFGEWYVGVMDDSEGMYAATVNESGGILGQYCFFASENCVWLIANDIACEPDGSYVILMNAESSAGDHKLKCFPNDARKEQPRYVFADFDAIDAPLRKSSFVGFAFPLESGKFQVSRFALYGMTKALDFMREGVTRLSKGSAGRKGGAKTGDITL